MPRKTLAEKTDALKERLSSLGFSLVSKWDGVRNSQIEVRCNSCGYTGFRCAVSSYSKITCHVCPSAYRIGKEKAHQMVSEKGFTITPDFRSVKDTYDFTCNTCGNTVKAKKFHAFMGGGVCKVCWKNPKLKSSDSINEAFRKTKLEPLDLSEYKDQYTKIRCSCKNCGHVQLVTPSSVFSGKRKQCESCDKVIGAYSPEAFISWVYSNQPDYRVVKAPPSRLAKASIKCPLGHIFSMTPKNFLRGDRCNVCSPRGFNPNKTGILYYLRVDTGGEPLWKIGITNLTVNQRFYNSDLEKITVLRELHFDIGRKAYELEQYYLNTFAEFRYTGEPILRSGNTELFTQNIFGIT